MKTTLCGFIAFLMLSMYSCANEIDEIAISQNEKNITFIREMAAGYGCEGVLIECTQERTTPLTDDEIRFYKGYFENMKKLNNIPVVFSPPIQTRETYNGTVEGFHVMVCWNGSGGKQDSDSSDIVAGVWGSIYNVYLHEIRYTLYYFDKKILSVSNGVIDLEIRADYRTEHYTFYNGGYNSNPSYVLKQKAYIKGYVDTTIMNGSFSLEKLGEGTWFDPKSNI